jgi:hypothetical protein
MLHIYIYVSEDNNLRPTQAHVLSPRAGRPTRPHSISVVNANWVQLDDNDHKVSFGRVRRLKLTSAFDYRYTETAYLR